ncbi:beta strand repeat-containing protein [Nevskia ramosa]|uniref:beta strand repeat-containing protein n=1 Tax=Nevskia ramosa TaxID=64002 RepID=UPI00235607D5|nr:hypothetical protein [Nevskia ramosa]
MSSNPKTIYIREGDAGLSAYEIAVNNGFAGTEAEWLAALQGGQNGWTPEIAVVEDGTRCVHQVVDWHGGTGLKPAAGFYLGPTGAVVSIAAATNIRGLPGSGEGEGNGAPGRGIASITRTAGNGAAGTTDTFTITYTDASTSTFEVKHGANGTASTVAGPAGRGVASIARTAGTGAAGTTDTYTITFSDGSTTTYQVVNGADGAASTVAGPAGRGVSSIARTSGNGAPGTTDTYTITFTDTSTTTFQVANGSDGDDGEDSTVPGPAGRGVTSIVRTAGTGAAGTIDTYTITFTDNATTTFQVANGANGADSTVAGPAGRGVASIARTAGSGAAGTTDTYTITFTDGATTTYQVVNGANGTASTVAGPAGRGVATIARTAGTGAAGTTDTYTITFTDGATTTYQVANGANGADSTVAGPAGRGVASVARTAGTGAAGSIDTYTITFTDSSTTTFQVTNGANGAASTVAGPAGRGISTVARTSGTGAPGTTDTYTITYSDASTSTFTVANGANGATPDLSGYVTTSAAASALSAKVDKGLASGSGLTLEGPGILGRTASGAGALIRLAIGAGLAFSGGALVATAGGDVDLMSAPTDGSSINTAVNDHLLAQPYAVNGGIARCVIPAGKYRAGIQINVAALATAGVKQVVIQGRGKNATTLLQAADDYGILWDASSREGAAIAVTAISLQPFITPGTTSSTQTRMHRLSVANSGYKINDIVRITSQDRPVYDLTGRWVGESFRVRAADTNYVWVEGALANADRYLTSPVVQKLDNAIKVSISDLGFEPTVPTLDQNPSTRRDAVYCIGTVGARVENVRFFDPWFIAVRFQSTADSIVRDCEFLEGHNQPQNDGTFAKTVSQLTYGLTCYGACYNCWMIDSRSTGFRHTFTTDGASSQASFVASSRYRYGEPTHCGAANCLAESSRGAPWDTHEEGRWISFYNCHETLSRGAVTSSDTRGYQGKSYNVRAKNVSIYNNSMSNSCEGIYWSLYEHGSDDWLLVQGTHVRATRAKQDAGSGIICNNEQKTTASGVITSNLVSRKRLLLRNTTFEECGYSARVTGGWVDIEAVNCNSLRPHLGHFDLYADTSGVPGSAAVGDATGTTPAIGNTVKIIGGYWDSNSADLPLAETANRVLFGVRSSGLATVTIAGLKHNLGPNISSARRIPALVQSTAGGNVLRLLEPVIQVDDFAVGPTPNVLSGDESEWTVTSAIADAGRVDDVLPADFVTTSATAASCGLEFTGGAGETWNIAAMLSGRCTNTTGMRITIGGPVGAVPSIRAMGNTSSATSYNVGGGLTALDTIGSPNGTYWNIADTELSAQLLGSVKFGANGGTVSIKVYSSTEAATTTIRAGSMLSATRVA